LGDKYELGNYLVTWIILDARREILLFILDDMIAALEKLGISDLLLVIGLYMVSMQ
jgi:hypothetical protein